MRKFLTFVFAPAAVAGVLLACTVTSNPLTALGTDGGDLPTTIDSGSSGKTDSGAKTDSGTAEGEVCKGSDPYEPGVKPNITRESACSDADVIAFFTACGAVVDKMDAADCVTALATTCGKCIATKETAAAWGPVIYTGADGYPNVNGCLQHVTGAKCGVELAHYNDCANAYCGQCETQEGLAACYEEADAKECAGYPLSKTCSDAFDKNSAAVEACYGEGASDQDYTNLIKLLIKQTCQSNGGSDAGTDAGDAGDGG